MLKAKLINITTMQKVHIVNAIDMGVEILGIDWQTIFDPPPKNPKKCLRTMIPAATFPSLVRQLLRQHGGHTLVKAMTVGLLQRAHDLDNIQIESNGTDNEFLIQLAEKSPFSNSILPLVKLILHKTENSTSYTFKKDILFQAIRLTPDWTNVLATLLLNSTTPRKIIQKVLVPVILQANSSQTIELSSIVRQILMAILLTSNDSAKLFYNELIAETPDFTAVFQNAVNEIYSSRASLPQDFDMRFKAFLDQNEELSGNNPAAEDGPAAGARNAGPAYNPLTLIIDEQGKPPYYNLMEAEAPPPE